MIQVKYDGLENHLPLLLLLLLQDEGLMWFLSYLFVLIFSVFTLFENDGPGGKPRVFKVKDVFPVREHQDASQVKLMWKKGRANYLILTF